MNVIKNEMSASFKLLPCPAVTFSLISATNKFINPFTCNCFCFLRQIAVIVKNSSQNEGLCNTCFAYVLF